MGARWCRVGGVTTTAAVVKVRTDGATVTVKYGTDGAVTSTSSSATVTNGMATVNLSGLTADTTYHYAPTVDGVTDWGKRGSFHTFPSGAATFTFAFSSCAAGGTTYPVTATDPMGTHLAHSNHAVFDAIRAAAPTFFMHIGDMHYEDYASTYEVDWRHIYDRVHDSPRQSMLYRNLATVYCFDNHDFYFVGPLGASAGSARGAFWAVYRERVPTYTLPSSGAVYQTWVCGRVRFILTDTISERSDWTATDNASKTMLGATQKQWFKDQLLAATEPVICWVMPAAPWIGGGPSDIANDRWSVFTTERTELANFIATNNLAAKLFICSGDAHMLAYDDGTNAPGGVHVLQAAPMDRGGNTLGGPYSSGTPTTLRGAFGLVTVTDTGGSTIAISFSGRRVRTQDSTATSQLVSGSFNIAVS